ncbi:hypothetical protein [Nonomuraea rubra]|uniref:hypothetical protein n=1 Tax=Nonomuraea rubra TaxID=46180 RepID=UPI0033F10D9A
MWIDYLPPICETARSLPFAVSGECWECKEAAVIVIPPKADEASAQCGICRALVYVARRHF